MLSIAAEPEGVITMRAAFDFDPFVKAQAPVVDDVLAELRSGRKRTHWMWFFFPQLRGLGRSGTADFYGLDSLAEAQAYARHPLLGPRLAACAKLVLTHPDRSLREIFGSPDDIKFRSCMTLFSVACGEEEPVFGQALETFCDGEPDARTLALIASGAGQASSSG